MKKCPQCEFLYEDEQSLCDMDGVLLVFDARPVPVSNALATRAKTPAHHSRNRLIPMLAALVLATVAYLVYFVSTQQPPTRNSYSPAGVSGSSTAPSGHSSTDRSVTIPTTASPSESAPVKDRVGKTEVPEKSATTTPALAGEEKPSAESEKGKNSETPAASDSEPSKEKAKPKAQPSTAPVKSRSSVKAHTESKITSFFKKTGRILKKPFKN